jgi:hypothetical protein
MIENPWIVTFLLQSNPIDDAFDQAANMIYGDNPRPKLTSEAQKMVHSIIGASQW